MTVTNIKSAICQTCQVLNNPKSWITFQNLLLVKCINFPLYNAMYNKVFCNFQTIYNL